MLVAASIGVLLAAKPAQAATFTLNRTGDESEPVANQGDGGCDALPSTAGNQCSLRAAIQEANANNNEPTVVDLIRFNIVSSASVKTISPSSQLPTITETVTINGYTQPGASPTTDAAGNDAVLKLQLNGTNAGDFTHGLAITASNSTIKGLVINRFKRFGILIEDFQIENADARANKVQGNFIGTNAKGSATLGNFGSVSISSTEANTVGGTAAGARNIISGNQRGVQISDEGASRNKVQGNFIGTDANGSVAIGNTVEGVLITGSASNNTVGGARPAGRATASPTTAMTGY